MRLAKPRVDIGLSTNNLAPMLQFWQGVVGLPFDHLLPIRAGQDQYRHDANGSVLKINHHAAPLADTAPSGYEELIVAQENRTAREALTDPDGNRVTLAPIDPKGVRQIGIVLGVRDLQAHRQFYTSVLGLEEEQDKGGAAFRAGETLILLRENERAEADAQIAGRGWRYITFQVFKVDDEHQQAIAAGGREGMAPITLGQTARISMIRDPDGNWIELSQRASIVGSLT